MKPDYSARKKGLPTMSMSERLYSRIVVKEDSGCWEWQGAKNHGYGRITIGSRKNGDRKSISTHRLSYILNYGEIPDGYEVCHKCDNPCCINPEHLFIGTRQDNIDDRERKGRNNPPRGIKNAKAKLTDSDVLEIRKKRNKGMTFRAIAAEYGVDKTTIQSAVSGENWAHVPFPQPTNFDRIKGMDEDEMAEFLTCLYGVAYMEYYPAPDVEEVKEWLSKPKGVQ